MSKRAASRSPKRGPKRSRYTKLIPTVVDAIDSEAVAEDLRSLLKISLPVTLNVNKSERSPWEAEVVAAAEKALGEVRKSLEQAHGTAKAAQDAVISGAEHKKRTSAKQAAEADLNKKKAALEASKTAHKNAGTAVNDAKSALKAAEKDAASAEKELAHHVEQKATLENLLAGEFTLLKDGTSAGAAGRKAVDKLTKLGKEFSLVGSTLLQTFSLACKKEAASRSEFESLMFTQYQAGINKGIAGLSTSVAEAEPVKAQKDAAVTNAQAALTAAEAALVAAAEAEKAAAAAHKESVKAVSQADSVLYSVWSDMKVVCDKQDAAKKTLTHFGSDIMSAFKDLKEKEPEPEPVEEPAPVEEAAPPAAPAEAAAAEAAAA